MTSSYGSVASLLGYGAIFGKRWIPSAKTYHITVLELYPIDTTVLTWGNRLKNPHKSLYNLAYTPFLLGKDCGTGILQLNITVKSQMRLLDDQAAGSRMLSGGISEHHLWSNVLVVQISSHVVSCCVTKWLRVVEVTHLEHS